MMWINATRIRDQAILILASCNSGRSIGAERSMHTDRAVRTYLVGTLHVPNSCRADHVRKFRS